MENNIKSENRFYCNSMGLKVNNVEFKLEVKYREDGLSENLCDIIMTPEQAKVTKIMLERAIEQYEATYRKLDISKNAVIKTEGEVVNGGEKQ